MARKGYAGTWDGGTVWVDSKGRKVYYINRTINGRRYHFSTGCHSAQAALEHLKRFEADPAHYTPEGSTERAPLYLDDDLRDKFLQWSTSKGNTSKWIAEQKAHLIEWSEALSGVDLRRASLERHILPALEETAGRKQRIEVIKALYGWLRKVRYSIKTSEDPTFGTLPVPAARAESGDKAFSREDYAAVLAVLTQTYRDALFILAGTGWHVTELIGFARGGEIEAAPTTGEAVLVVPRHKAGGVHKTRVSPAVAESARRLREHGTLHRRRFDAAVREANVAAGLEPGTVSPGRFRHTVATWAVNEGADPAVVASFLGHRSPETTKKFYAKHSVPTKVPTLD